MVLLAACSTSVATERGAKPTAVRIAADHQAFLETCQDWDDWDKPAPPFKIHANTYYVGTCGIASVLIKNGNEYVLIDTGTEKGAEVVLSNIRTLGIAPSDIEVIKISHEHFDHVGGIARIEAETGAIIVSSEAAIDVLFSGKPSAIDPQSNSGHQPFAPAKGPIVTIVQEIAAVVGTRKMTPIFTPGHSPGALSWQWQDCEGEKCHWIVYADSLSPISSDNYRFSDHPEYLAEYRAGLQRLREADCDMLLTPHPSASGMLERMASGTLKGGITCVEYADAVSERLDQRLAKEASGK